MNEIVKFCQFCGAKVQTDDSIYCWSCGKELPIIEKLSTPNQLFGSVNISTSDDIPINENPKKDFVKYLESQDLAYKESPKTETQPTMAGSLWKLEENTTSDKSDVKQEWAEKAEAKRQEKRKDIYKKNKEILYFILAINIFCGLTSFASYLEGGDFTLFIVFFIVMALSSLIAVESIMSLKENAPEKSSTSNQLSGSIKNPTSRDSVVKQSGVVNNRSISNSERKQKQSWGKIVALVITIIFVLFFFLAVMSNLLFGYQFSNSAPDLIGHTMTNIIGLIISTTIMGLILSSMKKNKPG